MKTTYHVDGSYSIAVYNNLIQKICIAKAALIKRSVCFVTTRYGSTVSNCTKRLVMKIWNKFEFDN